MRSARTGRSVGSISRGAARHLGRHMKACRRSHMTECCNNRFAHRSSPARRGRSRQDVNSDVVQSQSAALNVERRSCRMSVSSSCPLVCPLTSSPSALLGLRLVSAHFYSQQPANGRPRNFDKDQPFSSCDEAQSNQSYEGVANLQAVAGLLARPGSQIALI